ncbi:MAG: hypothetical protein NZ697_00220 [Porticoccaceae bacterium]|nr:hypothetical protein [Porticoccaceae bacterium]
MFKKLLLLITLTGLSGCSILGLPIAVVDTAASIISMPIKAVGKAADAVVGDDEEDAEE